MPQDQRRFCAPAPVAKKKTPGSGGEPGVLRNELCAIGASGRGGSSDAGND